MMMHILLEDTRYFCEKYSKKLIVLMDDNARWMETTLCKTVYVAHHVQWLYKWTSSSILDSMNNH